MQTIYDLNKSDNLIKNKIDSFYKNLEFESFFLLIKPTKNVYKNALDRELVERQIEKLIKEGFSNIEISWSNNEKWSNFVSSLKPLR